MNSHPHSTNLPPPVSMSDRISFTGGSVAAFIAVNGTRYRPSPKAVPPFTNAATIDTHRSLSGYMLSVSARSAASSLQHPVNGRVCYLVSWSAMNAPKRRVTLWRTVQPHILEKL